MPGDTAARRTFIVADARRFELQIVSYLNEAEGQYRVLLHLAGSSGMRAGELSFGVRLDTSQQS